MRRTNLRAIFLVLYIEDNFLNYKAMNIQTIRKINTAVDVLKHFVELSAQLLPYLKELKEKKNISETEKQDIQKINAVFQDYEVDEKTSVLLLNSDIIGLIKSAYKALKQQKREDDVAVKYYLTRFRKEYNRLSENWQLQELN